MSSNEESAALEPRVAIVVLNWNRWRLTKECLASIEHLSYSNRFVIVVDNGSTDDSVVQIQESFPETTIVRNDSNLGFAGGCNAGINRALADGAEYVFLLNNDATVEENTLRLLVGAAVRSRAAICGARVMDCEGTATQFNGRRWPMHIFGFDGVKTPGMSTGLTMTDCVDGCATTDTCWILATFCIVRIPTFACMQRGQASYVRLLTKPWSSTGWRKVPEALQTRGLFTI